PVPARRPARPKSATASAYPPRTCTAAEGSRPLGDRTTDVQLALLTEIGSALSERLGFDAILDLVGERIREAFAAPYMYIAIYDEASESISFPYNIEDRQRARYEPVPLGQGLTSIVIRTRKPLVLGTEAEQVALGALD